MKRSLLCFIAAALFAAAAALTIGEAGILHPGSILQLIAGLAFALFGVRAKRSET